MQNVTFAMGDGIGTEIMDATFKIPNAANVRIEWDEIEEGEAVYLSGSTSGISKEA